MVPRETENNAYAKFGVTKKEHYGMLWYFLEWSIRSRLRKHPFLLALRRWGRFVASGEERGETDVFAG